MERGKRIEVWGVHERAPFLLREAIGMGETSSLRRHDFGLAQSKNRRDRVRVSRKKVSGAFE
jgi:hypothetical protein